MNLYAKSMQIKSMHTGRKDWAAGINIELLDSNILQIELCQELDYQSLKAKVNRTGVHDQPDHDKHSFENLGPFD